MDLTLSRRGDYVTRAARAWPASTRRAATARSASWWPTPTSLPPSLRRSCPTWSVPVWSRPRRVSRALSADQRTAQISLLEVVEAAEGTLRPERCALSTDACRWEKVCPLHETWSEATKELRTILARTSLSELAARDMAIAAGMYPVPSDSHRSHPTTVELSDRAQVELGVTEAEAALAELPPQLGHLLEASTAEASIALETPRQRTLLRRHLVTWRRTEPFEASRFDGEVTVSAVDEQRCELELTGIWRLDGSAEGSTPEEIRTNAAASGTSLPAQPGPVARVDGGPRRLNTGQRFSCGGATRTPRRNSSRHWWTWTFR